MRKFVNYLVLVPLAIVLVMFAVANREVVTVSFDPFSSTDPAFALRMPLFALMFVFVMLGVLIGGVATWFTQAKWRRNNRRLQADIEALRRDVTLLGERVDVRDPAATLPAPESGIHYRPPVA